MCLHAYMHVLDHGAEAGSTEVIADLALSPSHIPATGPSGSGSGRLLLAAAPKRSRPDKGAGARLGARPPLPLSRAGDAKLQPDPRQHLCRVQCRLSEVQTDGHHGTNMAFASSHAPWQVIFPDGSMIHQSECSLALLHPLIALDMMHEAHRSRIWQVSIGTLIIMVCPAPWQQRR